MENHARCEICGLDVILNDEQSPRANTLLVHQIPCLHVYYASRMRRIDPEIEFTEVLTRLFETSEWLMQHQRNLMIPYYNWLLALYVNLSEQKSLLQMLDDKYDEMENKKDKL